MQFNERFKELRERNKYTQKEFGKIIGVSAPTIVAYEKGDKKPSYETLLIIADKFDVSLDWLCGRDREPKIVTWTDYIKLIYKILKYKSVGVDVEYDEERDKLNMGFDCYLVEPDYYTDLSLTSYETMFGRVYGKGCKKNIDDMDLEGGNDIGMFTISNPICDFIGTYQNMKSLLEDKNIDQELFDLWLEKQFQKYDYRICRDDLSKSFAENSFEAGETNANNNETE